MMGHRRKNELIGVLIISAAAAERAVARRQERDNIKYLTRNAGRALACN